LPMLSGLRLCPVDDDSKKVENRRRRDSAKRRSEKIKLGDDCIAKQKRETKRKQEPRVKEKSTVAHGEVTVQCAKENKAETMGRVDADPYPPDWGFSADDR